jgi:REP element-mobilizing transposase RayT
MARALRIEWPGGRYHITARGNERRDIFGAGRFGASLMEDDVGLQEVGWAAVCI